MIRSALKIQRAAVWSATLMALAFTLTGHALAQDSWSLRISEKEQMLNHTDPVTGVTDPMWNKWLMWDIGYQRMMDRNMPYLEVTNAATSTDPITQFHLSIGDTRFNFAPVQGSDLVLLGSTTPGITLAASTIGGLGDDLTVNIGGGGLAPGQTVRFKIKLGIDPSFAAAYAASFGASLPDYRTVLFDMNGINVYDGNTHSPSTADNAAASVVFDTDIKSNTAVFPDETVAPGEFYNNILRPYTAMDNVNLFVLKGQPIPEPGSMGLAMLGIAGILLRRRARRR